MGDVAIPAVVMRGGTSRGVFFLESDLPADPQRRDRAFLDVMGSPDPVQVDGLGGTYSSNSKVMAVASSDRDDVDVEYLFGQVAVTEPAVHYGANCGSLATAVGAFAIDVGLAEDIEEPVTRLVLLDRNTGVRIRAHVPVRDGRAALEGDFRMAGVTHPGAPIVTEYLDPAGPVAGSGALPTGLAQEEIDVPGVGALRVSMVDVSSLMIYVRAEDLGFPALAEPKVVNTDAEALRRAEAVRAACSKHLKLVGPDEDAFAVLPQQPKLVLCSSPGDGGDGHGATPPVSLHIRSFSMGRMHLAIPVTGMVCSAAATAIPGTIPHELRGDEGADVVLAHARGEVPLTVELAGSGPDVEVRSVAITQTARRIMAGEVYVRP